MNLQFYSYRFAEEVLGSPSFRPIRDEIVDALRAAGVPRLQQPKIRTRGGRTRQFTVDQRALNQHLQDEFRQRSWELEPWIVADRGTQLKADYKKSRVQIEVQFGNIARVIYDLFKLQMSYSQGLIDVGVIVVPIQSLAHQIDENVAYYERLVRELGYAKMSITLPIWVIGVSD